MSAVDIMIENARASGNEDELKTALAAKAAIQAQMDANTFTTTTSPPATGATVAATTTGYLLKRGGIIKISQKRYFELKDQKLQYLSAPVLHCNILHSNFVDGF
jgi:hypothetical protein